jgi:hypothetical protein
LPRLIKKKASRQKCLLAFFIMEKKDDGLRILKSF